MKKAVFFGESLVDIVKNPSKDYHTHSLPGGAMLNAASISALLGAETVLLSSVGSDENGMLIEEALRQRGVELSEPFVIDGGITKTAIATLDFEGKASYEFSRALLKPPSVDSVMLQEQDLVCFGSFYPLQEENGEVADQFIDRAKKAQCIIAFDPNYRPSHVQQLQQCKSKIEAFIDQADIIKASTDDVEIIWGADKKRSMETLSKRFGAKKMIIVTDGSNGVQALCNAKQYTVSGIEIAVDDTVGAGDAFSGAMAAYYVKNGFPDDPTPMIAYANSIAALSCSWKGAYPPIELARIIKGK